MIKEAEFLIKELNKPQGKSGIGRMETICAILNEKKDVLKELDEKVITLCEITDIEREIEEANEVMSRILDIQRIICEKSKQKIAHMKSKT